MAAYSCNFCLGLLLSCCAIRVLGNATCPMTGIQTIFHMSDLPQGWETHSEHEYSHTTTLADIRPGKGECILWGAENIAQRGVLRIAAFGDRIQVERDSPGFWHNQVFWYTVPGQANGFSPVSDISLAPGDTKDSRCAQRMSWPLTGVGGYRAGCKTTREGPLDDWRKVVMYGPSAQMCTVSICPSGMILKVQGLPEFCKGIACTKEECCQSAGHCSQNPCGGVYVMKKPEDLPLFCVGAICSEPECCTRAPKCSTSDCSVGYSLKLGARLPTQCVIHTCTQEECCAQNPACTNDVCGTGYVIKSKGLPFACNGRNCTAGECCADAGTCNVSVCLGEYVYKPADQRPAFCGNITCTVSECCGGYVAPTIGVLSVSFVDLDLDFGQFGGQVSWRPPVTDRVAKFKVYVGSSLSDKVLIGSVNWGTNVLAIPADTAARRYIMVATANDAGEQVNPFMLYANDTNLIPTNLGFVDLDLDTGEIGSTVSWTHPAGHHPSLLSSYNVYLAQDSSGTNKSLLGVTSSTQDSFLISPDTPYKTYINIFPVSPVAERTSPASMAIDDNYASVSKVEFEADSASLSTSEIAGKLTWEPPTSNLVHVTGYRVYLSSTASAEGGVPRIQMGEDIPVGTNEAQIPAGTKKDNATHIVVFVTSSFTENSRPTAMEIVIAAGTLAAASGLLGVAALGRATSAATGANAAGNAVEGMNMEKMERCAVKTSNAVNKPVTAIGSFMNKDRERFYIQGCGGQYIRSICNSALPCCVHHHHRQVVLKGPGKTKFVLNRLHFCENTWDNDEVLLKKVSNSYYSVHGLTEEPFLLKRRLPKTVLFSPLGMSGLMAKGLAPLMALLVIAVVVCGMQDWMTGGILVVVAFLALGLAISAKPGGTISQCIESISTLPPERIRKPFWACVGLMVGVLPCAPAFMAGTVIGILTGLTAVIGAILTFLGRDVLAMALQFFAGVTLTIFIIVSTAIATADSAEEEDEQQKVDIIMFVSASLVFVAAIDTYVKNTNAKFTDIDIPGDELLVAAEQSARDIGVCVTHALALEAFIQGHLEARLERRVVLALEAVSKEAVTLGTAVLNLLVLEVQEQGVEKSRKMFEKRLPRINEACAPLRSHDPGIVNGAREEDSPWEDFEVSLGKLVVDAFSERFIREFKKSIKTTKESFDVLQSRLDSMRRLAGLDGRAAHHLSTVIVGTRAESAKELSDDLKRKVPADGNIVLVSKFHEKVDLITEDLIRIDKVLADMLEISGAEEFETGPRPIAIDKLEKAKTNSIRAARALANIKNMVEPKAAMPAEHVTQIVQHLGVVSDATGLVRNIGPRSEEMMSRASTMPMNKAVMEEAEADLPQLAGVKHADVRAEIVAAYCSARNTAAIVSLISDEVTAMVARAEVVVELLEEGRKIGTRILGELREARKAQTLHLLALRDETLEFVARYPQRIWTRVQVLHYTVDKRFGDALIKEMDRAVSQDVRDEIAQSFSLVSRSKIGGAQSRWYSKIFTHRQPRKVHPDRLPLADNRKEGSLYRSNTRGNLAGRMTTGGPSYRNTVTTN